MASSRITAWLGDGRLAVAGWDNASQGSDGKLLGLRVLDTRSWRARTLDWDTDFFCVAGHSIVAHHVDGTVVVFGFDTVRRLAFTLPDAPSFPVPVASNDRYLYLPAPDGVDVTDLVSRRSVGRIQVRGLDAILSPTYTLGAGGR
jgi:hypothetical protein